jgi:alkylhydroperoxidase/carboxymuconolactone decarboxylase family protein YurZ
MRYNARIASMRIPPIRLQKGADENQMMEAIHVAAAIKGGATLVHGVQMMNKLKEVSM